MTKKIFRSILAAALLVLALSLVFVAGFLYDYFAGVQTDQLKTELELASRGVELSGTGYLEDLRARDYRVTLVDPQGRVLYDSQADPQEMENHSDREEIQEAMAQGRGSSARYSSTLLQETLYEAQRLPDGSVLRLSASRATPAGVLLSLLQPITVIILLAAVVSILLANRMAKRVVEPLNRLDLEHPLENDAYEELSPLLRRIGDQHREIAAQERALEDRQREFSAVTDSMKEGLVLLNRGGKVLSVNPAALEFLGASGDCVGRDLLTLERDRQVWEGLHEAEQDGWAERLIQRSGRQYQLHFSRIGGGEERSGTVLLIVDVTEKLLAEQSRREFTANVSHELKTPLHTIMASAELLENGLVSQEDAPHFVGKLRREASRLVALIDDIIRLSQLDEGGELPSERVDLYAVAKEETEALAQAAAEKQVSLVLQGGPAPVSGAPQLFREIICNLCGNGIKYNVPGGSVTVTVSPLEEGARLTVADTGVGIPPEDRERVFERFYRVDKSRSKETGGTGLGLSIVKHAVRGLGGEISLKSELGKGTEVTVLLPLSGVPAPAGQKPSLQEQEREQEQ